MPSWIEDARLWIPLAGLVAQAAITWWKVNTQERAQERMQESIDGLREWRAQAREQINELQNSIERLER